MNVTLGATSSHKTPVSCTFLSRASKDAFLSKAVSKLETIDYWQYLCFVHKECIKKND